MNYKIDNERKKRWEAKARVFEKYGNSCSCCGLKDQRYFTIDHVYGNGKVHKKSVGIYFYTWLDHQPKSDKFQILCWNCNCAKGNWGSCPHKEGFQWKIVKHLSARKDKVNLKLAAFNRYGKFCECCGEDTYEFLCVDHINKDGADHRKEIGKRYHSNIYRWLRDNNYPEGFRILCYNCNNVSFLFNICHIIKLILPLTYSKWPVTTDNSFKSRTHCFKGHAFYGDNLMIRENGARRCRICRNEINRKYRQKLKEVKYLYAQDRIGA